MDRATQGREMQKIGSAPEWAVGSVHAVTETGQIIIASNNIRIGYILILRNTQKTTIPPNTPMSNKIPHPGKV